MLRRQPLRTVGAVQANAAVVCLDETSKELHSTPRGELSPQPEKTTCQDYES